MTTVIIGLSLGMLLFLLAAGLTIIFGMLGIINFAHGSFYALGAYLSWQVGQWTGSFWISLLLAPLVAATIGGLLESLLLRPLYDRDHVMQFLMTFGFILLIEEFIRTVWGLDYKNVAGPPGFSGSVDLFGSQVGVYRLFVICFGATMAGSLFAVMEYTPAGMVLRAAVSNSTMVRCLGIRVSRIRTAAFAVGTGLAAVGGVIAAPMLSAYPGMGFSIVNDCFMVVILGGLGNIHGAIAGALIIGMVRAIGQRVAPEWVDFITYGVFIVVILFRPQGLVFRATRSA